MRWILRALALVIILPILYLAVALVGAVVPGQVMTVPTTPKDHQILLVAGPIHYDVLVPIDLVPSHLHQRAERAGIPVAHPDVDWLVIGWGSRAFYTATATLAEMELSTIWTAASGDSSVIRLDVAGALPPTFPATRVAVSTDQIATLIDQALALAAPTALPGASLTGTDAFFATPDRFHLFQTCNVWMGDLLRRAGIGTGVWTPTTWSLRWSLALHH